MKIAIRDQAWDYDGTAHKLDQSAYTIEGLKDGDTLNVTLSIVDAYGNTLSSVTNAGNYSIRADVSGYDPERYVVSATNVGTLNVSRRELTVTAQSASKTYDGNALANKYYTAKGLLNGHSIPVDGVSFSIMDSSGNSLGEWPSATGVYTKKIASVHIVDSNGTDVTNNYNITKVSGTLTLQKAPDPTTVTVTVKNQSWSYDGTAHKLDQSAYSVQGLKSGDTLTVKLNIVDAYGNILSTVTNAGSYSIRAEVSGYDPERYVVSATNIGTLNVSRRELTITAQSASKTYDGNALADRNYSTKGFLEGHSIPVDGVQFSIIDSSGSLLSGWPSEPGVYTKKITSVHIVDSNGADVTSNYDITYITGTITIQLPVTTTPVNRPSAADLDVLGVKLVYPKEASYLSSYETMYVKSEKGVAIWAYDRAQLSRYPEYRVKNVPERTEVTVIARESGCSCIIYTDTSGERRAAWVGSEHLVYVYN